MCHVEVCCSILSTRVSMSTPATPPISPGAIFGIVLAVLVILGGVGWLGVSLWKRRQARILAQHEEHIERQRVTTQQQGLMHGMAGVDVYQGTLMGIPAVPYAHPT